MGTPEAAQSEQTEIVQLRQHVAELEARCQAVTAERDALRAALADVWDAMAEHVASWGEDDVPDGTALGEGIRMTLRDLSQQLAVLRPGGSYAWKTKYEAAEAAESSLRATLGSLVEQWRETVLAIGPNLEGAAFEQCANQVEQVLGAAPREGQ